MAENAEKTAETELKSEERSKLRLSPEQASPQLLVKGEDGSSGLAPDEEMQESATAIKENAPQPMGADLAVRSDRQDRALQDDINLAPQELDAAAVRDPVAAASNRPLVSKKSPSVSVLDLPDVNTFTRGAHGGLLRHWSVAGACMALAGGILALSMLDLNSLIKRESTIDDNLQVTYLAKPDQLPPNLSFKRGPRYIGGHWTPRDYSGYGYQQDIPQMSEGLLPVSESTWGKTLEGFVDASGKVVIVPQFNAVGDFHDGLALAQPTGSDRWGYIDHSGKFVIKPIYRKACDFRKTLANVAADNDHILIDRNGNTITTGAIRDLGFGYLVKKAGKYGIVDAKGSYILTPEYNEISSFPKDSNHYSNYPFAYNRDDEYAEDSPSNSQYLKVNKDGKWGVVDSSGNFLIEPKYAGIVSFKNGHAGVVVHGKIGFVDQSGKMVLPPVYDFATAYDDLIAVKIGADWRLIRQTGEIALDQGIDGVICNRSGDWLSEGLGAVISNKLAGFVDKNGVMVIPPSFHYVLSFKKGHAAVWDGTFWRFINARGEYLSNEKFAMLQPFIHGEASVEIPGIFYSIGNRREITSEESRLSSSISFFGTPTIKWMRDLDNHGNQPAD
jgi:hypothetical protein